MESGGFPATAVTWRGHFYKLIYCWEVSLYQKYAKNGTKMVKLYQYAKNGIAKVEIYLFTNVVLQ